MLVTLTAVTQATNDNKQAVPGLASGKPILIGLLSSRIVPTKLRPAWLSVVMGWSMVVVAAAGAMHMRFGGLGRGSLHRHRQWLAAHRGGH